MITIDVSSVIEVVKHVPNRSIYMDVHHVGKEIIFSVLLLEMVKRLN